MMILAHGERPQFPLWVRGALAPLDLPVVCSTRHRELCALAFALPLDLAILEWRAADLVTLAAACETMCLHCPTLVVSSLQPTRATVRFDAWLAEGSEPEQLALAVHRLLSRRGSARDA